MSEHIEVFEECPVCHGANRLWALCLTCANSGKILVKKEAVKIMETAFNQLKDLAEKLKQEAQAHAMEADTQKGTVLEIYQSLGIQKGDWNGKQPVVEIVDQLKARIARLEYGMARIHLHCHEMYPSTIEVLASDLLNESPKQSLVEHDCEVIHKVKLEVLGTMDLWEGFNVLTASKWFDDYEAKLRNSVKDGE